MPDQPQVLRCETVWSDKGLLTALVDAKDATIHDCHRAKGHVGDHVCACSKKLPQQ